ncbi:MAG: sigma-70 family RNA polymerase sigma factor [Polyangiaceae bacterium]|nr:sigma-70 family RNA polymerase sigma factor [Polyangiaceae bacterium]MCW5791200.1 sigma-70 family RNA polymerase sigma factor [Polyangiaceae bacterium]
METQAAVTSLPLRPVETPETAEERVLLVGLLRDDQRAWQTFNARYSRLIYRCITKVTGRFSAVVGPDDIREIYAALCLSLLANDKRKLRTFEPGRGNKLGSWIGMLAIHAAYDYLRGLKREPKRGCLAEAETLSSQTPDPYEQVLMRQRARIVARLLESFSDKDRQFITLYYGEGLDPEVIADQMQISVKTVYSKKHKIRTRLAELLQGAALAA